MCDIVCSGGRSDRDVEIANETGFELVHPSMDEHCIQGDRMRTSVICNAKRTNDVTRREQRDGW